MSNSFEEFKRERFEATPGDYSHNDFGFKHRENHSDVSAHLPLLTYFASQCNHVTEFGTRNCFSTVAFLAGKPSQVVSYDIQATPDIEELKSMDLPSKWEFNLQDTADPNLEIAHTDFLFIDTLHTYEQVKAELKQANKVSKFIGFHDTYSQWENSLDVPDKEGIGRAIEEFLKDNPEWSIIYKVDFNHGLMIIERN